MTTDEERYDTEDTERKAFDKWKKEVDVEVQKIVGVSCDDLPDVDYWALYEAGDDAKEAAEYVLLYAELDNSYISISDIVEE